jgi:tetratricopeptide (TPR) repeat protein
MHRKITTAFLKISVLITLLCSPLANASPRPLKKSELLALVAGDTLPENVIGEISARGLAFVPDVAYKALLRSAGADSQVLAALASAKSVSPAQADSSKDVELLKHLSRSGTLIRAGQSEAAAQELSTLFASGFGKSEVGFVIGIALIQQQRFEEAGQVYSEILRQDPDFPQTHSRLSMTFFQSGDPEQALRHAKAAIEQFSCNPAAHMNAGLALKTMHNLEAAKSEIQEAIRCKPDYALAYSNLGGLYDDLGAYDEAIAQFKKALTLNPVDVNTRYNLGVSYGNKGDFVSAIREYREVKRRDPERLDARQNLGAALLHTDPAAAIVEFRELAALAPDFTICHVCLGAALYTTGRYDEAAKEYQLAAQLDPANPRPLIEFGHTLEVAKKYDETLSQYRKAADLDPNLADARANAGRVLLQKKAFAEAATELKRAEELDPAAWESHDLRGQALEGSGDRNAAIAEYREALSLGPKEPQARLDLAQALEKAGDWVGALSNYHRAALDEPPLKPGAVRLYEARAKYDQAQQRFHMHLSGLRAAGNGQEAAVLEARVSAAESAPNLDDEYRETLQKSLQAVQQQRFNDAETSARRAIEIAQQIQPQDGRLPEALGQLGSVYAWRMDYKNAQETFQHQLAFAERIFGPQSPLIAPVLQNLAMLAAAQKDFAAAEPLLTRMLEVNQKAYGEQSDAMVEGLRGLARVYAMQKDYPKSEAALLRALKILETLRSPSDPLVALPLTSLCRVYDEWGKPEKAEPCHARLVSMAESQFGADSPYLVNELSAEAEALRKLGRTAEAARLEQRSQSIQAAQSAPPRP